ncbi:unnamed protein product [Prunus armeniaca]
MRCGCARACQHGLPCVEVRMRFSYAEADNPAEAEGNEVEMSSAEVSIDKPLSAKDLSRSTTVAPRFPTPNSRLEKRRPTLLI